jgi:hypothetical protein
MFKEHQYLANETHYQRSDNDRVVKLLAVR